MPKGNGGWQARPVSTRLQIEPGLMVYRFTHSLYYANAQLLIDQGTGSGLDFCSGPVTMP